jgi:hypothetical protein
VFQSLVFQSLVFQSLVFQSLVFQSLVFQSLVFQNLVSRRGRVLAEPSPFLPSWHACSIREQWRGPGR